MNEEERKCLNDCGFANVTQLLLAYVSLQQENFELKENYKAILKQRDDTNKSAVETIEKYQQENARLKDKIDKAVEYIKTNCKEWGNDDYDVTLYYSLNQNECDELLELLKEN